MTTASSTGAGGRRPFTRLTHRLVALLIIGGLTVWAILHSIYAHERMLHRLRAGTLSVAEKAVLLHRAMAATQGDIHETIIEAFTSRFLQARLTADPPMQNAERWRHAEEIDSSIRTYLATQDIPDYVLAYPQREPGRREWGKDNERRSGRGDRFIVAIQQPDGQWLQISARLFALAGPGVGAFMGWSVASLILVIVLFIFISRRMTRPITRFAEAAERLGIDVSAPPLEEKGAFEVRNAARAFNEMQQRIQKLLADRTQTLAAISHDLRTMLTRLRLRVELIDQETLRDRSLQDLDTMDEMLKTTLDYAREEGREESFKSLDLAALLQTLCDERNDLLSGDPDGATADVDEGISYSGIQRLSVSGQPTGLRRAFDNLLENALRYATQASVTLRRDDGYAVIEISDNGPGIVAQDLERVFEPFTRLENSRNRDTGGSGLGLTVVRSIIERHTGEVQLKNRTEGGLCATVKLPLAP